VTTVTGPADRARQPALGPRKKAVFLHFFYPIPYYLGSHDDRHHLDAFGVGVGIVRAVVGPTRAESVAQASMAEALRLYEI
jgi:hypothetical protein